jgi:hypothetical protein
LKEINPPLWGGKLKNNKYVNYNVDFLPHPDSHPQGFGETQQGYVGRHIHKIVMLTF